MKHVLGVFWHALRDLWDELLILVLMNIVTTLLLIPIITFPPAVAGLWNAANRAADGRTIHWSDYFEGFRRYFWKAWGLALLNILLAVVLLTNVRFYAPDSAPFNVSPTLSLWIRALFLGVALLWLIVQMYPMALLLEQADQRLRVALRNAAVLSAANPGFTVALAVILLLVATISTLFPVLWVIVTLAIFAVVCNKAVLYLLKPHRNRTQGEAADGSEPS